MREHSVCQGHQSRMTRLASEGTTPTESSGCEASSRNDAMPSSRPGDLVHWAGAARRPLVSATSFLSFQPKVHCRSQANTYQERREAQKPNVRWFVKGQTPNQPDEPQQDEEVAHTAHDPRNRSIANPCPCRHGSQCDRYRSRCVEPSRDRRTDVKLSPTLRCSLSPTGSLVASSYAPGSIRLRRRPATAWLRQDGGRARV
jgi:hypothetical protein